MLQQIIFYIGVACIIGGAYWSLKDALTNPEGQGHERGQYVLGIGITLIFIVIYLKELSQI